MDAVLGGEHGLLDQRGRGRAALAHVAGVGADLDEPADERDRRAREQHRREWAQRRARRRSARAGRPAGASTSSFSGSSVAAPIRPPTTPHSKPSANVFPADGDTFVASVSPPITANTSISRPNGTADEQRPAEPGERGRALRAVDLPAGRERDRRQRDRQQDHRVDRGCRPAGSPDRPSARAASRPPAGTSSTSSEASRPASPISDASGVMSAIRNPATSTTPAAAEPAIAAAMIPGSASRSRSRPDSSAACGSTAPIRSWNVLGGVAEASPPPWAPAAGRPGSPPRWGTSARAGPRLPAPRAPAPAAAPPGSRPRSGTSAPAGRRSRRSRNSSWLAPQDEQKRARALMRSPQLGQKLVSFKKFPFASLALNGYHLRPMDRSGWLTDRPRARRPVVVCRSARARASRADPRRRLHPAAAAAPMKVFVITDMEGVAGICRWDQVVAGKPGYEEGRGSSTPRSSMPRCGARSPRARPTSW